MLARVLQVGTSGYYGWIHKPNSPRHDQDAKLQGIIRNLFDHSRGTYGSPRIHQDVLLLGHRVSRKRIERLMKEIGISARRPARFVRTMDSDQIFTTSTLRLSIILARAEPRPPSYLHALFYVILDLKSYIT